MGVMDEMLVAILSDIRLLIALLVIFFKHQFRNV